jgi:hypothetical protein
MTSDWHQIAMDHGRQYNTHQPPFGTDVPLSLLYLSASHEDNHPAPLLMVGAHSYQPLIDAFRASEVLLLHTSHPYQLLPRSSFPLYPFNVGLIPGWFPCSVGQLGSALRRFDVFLASTLKRPSTQGIHAANGAGRPVYLEAQESNRSPFPNRISR